MRKPLFTLSILLFAFPAMVGAHGGSDSTMMDFGDVDTGTEMMQFVEDKTLGENLHEEMEELMAKMMAGTMTEQETGRMITLMEEYPGPYGMIMNRMIGMNFGHNTKMGGFNMMSSGGMMGFGGLWFWIVGLCSLAWLIVGILASLWLWKQITKK